MAEGVDGVDHGVDASIILCIAHKFVTCMCALDDFDNVQLIDRKEFACM
jgi:hypothetical protein